VRVWVEQISVAHAVLDARLYRTAPVRVELAGLLGSLTYGGGETRGQLEQVSVVARGVLPEEIQLRIHGAATLPDEGQPGGSVVVLGTAGDVPLSLRARLEADHLDARLDVPAVDPESLRALVPSIPLHAPASLRLVVTGTLPELALNGRLTAGTGEVTLDATGRLAPAARASATLRATGIDVRAFSPTAPTTNAEAVAHLEARAGEDGAWQGSYDVTSRPFRFGAERVPGARVKGTFTEQSAKGTVLVDEPGAPAQVDFHLRPEKPGAPAKVVDFDLSVQAPALQRVERLGKGARGSAGLRARGTYGLADSRLSTTVQVNAARVAVDELRVRSAQLEAKVEGAVSDPSLHARLDATGLQWGQYAWDTAKLEAGGRRSALRVGAVLDSRQQPDITFGAVLHADKQLSVSNAKLGLFHRGERLHVVAADVSLGDDGGWSAQRVRLTGAGDPAVASVQVSPAGSTIRLSAPNLRLDRLARMLGQQHRLRSGRVGIDLDLRVDRRGAHGYLIADVIEAAAGEFPGAVAHFEGQFRGRQVRSEVNVAVDGIGSAWVTADGSVGGNAMAVEAWKQATGRATVDSELDLAALAAWLPSLPAEVAGALKVRMVARRAAPGELPELELYAATRGLSAQGRAKTTAVTDPPPGTELATELPWHLEGVDVQVHARLGDDGASRVHLVAGDRRGPLASLEARATLPLERLRREGAATGELLAELPVRAMLHVPRRPILSIPVLGPRAGVRGDIAVAAFVSGSMNEPRVLVAGQVNGLELAQARSSPAFDAQATVGYAGTHGTAHLRVLRPEGTVLEAATDVVVDGALADVTASEGWTASAWATLKRFPLGILPQRTNDPVQGALSGEVQLRELRKDASMRADLQLHEVRMSDVHFPEGRVTASLGDGKMQADVALRQSDGRLQVTASGGSRWGSELAPSLDPGQPIDVRLEAERFRVKALLPFVRGTFSELDGRVDGSARVQLDPSERRATMQGELNLTEGLLEVPAIGSQYRDVQARLRMEPGGTVRVDDISTRETSRRLRASAQARLDGLDVREARLELNIKEGDKLPLAIEGESIGQVWGRVTATATMDPQAGRTEAVIDVRSFNLQLPDALSNDVQSLEKDPTIQVGMHASDGKLVLLPSGPTSKAKPEEPAAAEGPQQQVRLQVKLGDVWITRDTSIRVQLTGGATLEQQGEQRDMSGTIQLVQGRATFFGRKFEVENGTITFEGDDPSNPVANLTAFYDSPENVRVFADFVGPVKSGKVTLRSEPPLSENEIVAVLLFGSPEGQFGAASAPSQQASGAARAAGIGGGLATQTLNKALSNVVPFEVTANLDTSQSQNPRPELAVQISRDLWAQISYALGLPAPG
jgi:translocation and assembly module TamB